MTLSSPSVSASPSVPSASPLALAAYCPEVRVTIRKSQVHLPATSPEVINGETIEECLVYLSKFKEGWSALPEEDELEVREVAKQLHRVQGLLKAGYGIVGAACVLATGGNFIPHATVAALVSGAGGSAANLSGYHIGGKTTFAEGDAEVPRTRIVGRVKLMFEQIALHFLRVSLPNKAARVEQAAAILSNLPLISASLRLGLEIKPDDPKERAYVTRCVHSIVLDLRETISWIRTPESQFRFTSALLANEFTTYHSALEITDLKREFALLKQQMQLLLSSRGAAADRDDKKT
jgi:hypothetical protein